MQKPDVSLSDEGLPDVSLSDEVYQMYHYMYHCLMRFTKLLALCVCVCVCVCVCGVRSFEDGGPWEPLWG